MYKISKYRKLNYEEFTQNIGLYTCVSYSLSMQIKSILFHKVTFLKSLFTLHKVQKNKVQNVRSKLLISQQSQSFWINNERSY